MNLCVENTHEDVNFIKVTFLSQFRCFHSKSWHNYSNRTDVTTSIFALTETIDIPTICSSASHSREVSARVVLIISSIAGPVNVSIVRIESGCSRSKSQSLQIVVWSTRFFINSTHNLENTARENRGLAQFTSTLNRAFNQCFDNKSTFNRGASTIVDRSEWKLISTSGLKSI